MKNVMLSNDAQWVELLHGLINLQMLAFTGSKSPYKAAGKQQIEEQQKFVAKLYRGVLEFLQERFERDDTFLHKKETCLGLKSLMEFVKEGKDNVEKYTNWFSSGSSPCSLESLAEYCNLMDFYRSAIEPHLPKEVADEPWEKQWGASHLPLAKEEEGALHNLYKLVEDGQYDLMLILEKSGAVLFDYDFLRHCRMLYELKKLLKEDVAEDKREKLHLIFDRQIHLLSVAILKDAWDLMQEFFSLSVNLKDSPFIKDVSAAVMALMLSANPRNLKQTSQAEKSAAGYYQDFQRHLRKVVSSEEYQRLSSLPEDSRPLHLNLIMLIDKLSLAFFTELTDDKELSAYIKRIAHTGGYREDETKGFIAELNNIDLALRKGLSSTLLAAIAYIDKLFQLRQVGAGFDPLSQGNIPRALFSFLSRKKSVTCLRMPAPLQQHFISKAEVAQEFKAFLHALESHMPKQKILLINLQERTSLYEHARCIALENLCQSSPFSDSMALLGLATSGDFYHQRGVFEPVNDARSFFRIVEDHILGGSDYGFFYRPAFHKTLQKQLPEILCFTREIFFPKEKKLSHEMRCSFIDLCYLFIVALALEEEKVSFISFLDKDAVGKSSSMSTLWYCLCKMMQGYLMTREDITSVVSMLYGHGLSLRGQLLREDLVKRLESNLKVIEQAMPQLKKELAKKDKSKFCHLGLV